MRPVLRFVKKHLLLWGRVFFVWEKGLGGLFIFLTLLPILLIILGYSIIVLAVYIVYKAWLEEPVLNLIQKLKSRRNG